jgi:DNA-binding protein H-NS
VNRAPMIYQSPDDATQQWSGRGRHPQWVKTHLNAGKSLDAVRISK